MQRVRRRNLATWQPLIVLLCWINTSFCTFWSINRNKWLIFERFFANRSWVYHLLYRATPLVYPRISTFQKKQELVHQCDLAVSIHTTQTPYCHFDCLFCADGRLAPRHSHKENLKWHLVLHQGTETYPMAIFRALFTRRKSNLLLENRQLSVILLISINSVKRSHKVTL